MSKFKDNMKYVLYIFSFIKPYKIPFSIGTFLYSSQSFVFGLILSIFSASIMDAILFSDSTIAINAAIHMIIATFLAFIFLGFGVYFYVASGATATRDLKQLVFRSFIKDTEGSSHSGEAIAAINTDASAASDVYKNLLSPVISSCISIIFSLITIFLVNWMMGLAAIFVGLISFFLQNKFSKPIGQIAKDRLETNVDAISILTDILHGSMIVRTYNASNYFLVKFDEENNKIKLLDIRRGIISMWQQTFTTLQGFLISITVFGFGSWLVHTNQLYLSQIMFLLGIFAVFVDGFGSLGKNYADFQSTFVACQRIYNIVHNSIEERTTSTTKIPTSYEISIKNLDFKYKNEEENSLHDINLQIDQNKMVAFVGESGSGKTTLLRNILGMYHRDNLGLYIGGVSFNDISIQDYRKNFAYVDQDSKLFNMSISQNIALGSLNNSTKEEIIEAAKKAAAHDFIESLEQGYDTICGENGANLSGGQKQRVAIARALIKKSPILVFDEITASLDKDTEKEIMSTIENLRKEHTIIMTTHNLDNIQTADIVVEMEKGRIDNIAKPNH